MGILFTAGPFACRVRDRIAVGLALQLSCIAVVWLTTGLAAASEVADAEPLQCWWRTSASAVRVGEAFSAVLTCATVETTALSVVVDRTMLEPVAAALPPFEVLGGKRSTDLLTGDRRFFQYEYSIRLISDELFDRDVQLPDLPITYRLRSSVDGQAAAVEGPTQRYSLPPIAIRILSLVPDTERDIRDATTGTFASLDEDRSRADILVTIGMVVSVLGVGLTAVGMMTVLVQRRRGPRAERARRVSNGAIIRSVRRELKAIERERVASGWTAPLVGRALAALRILAAYALDRPVTQRRVAPTASTAGSVALRSWASRDAGVTASGAVTTETVASALAAASSGNAGGMRTARLEAMQAALRTFTESQYGSGAVSDDARLDAALAAAVRLASQLARERSALGRVARHAARMGSRVWAR
jgi:hypothetical protein